jgi:hypothetical protein
MGALVTTATASVGFGARLKRSFVALVVGVAFVIASVPNGTSSLARREGWTWLSGPAQASKGLEALLPPVPSLLQWITYALMAYAGALLLVSLRHLRPGLIGWGLGILVGSACLLHLLAWVGVVIFAVGRFLARLFAVVAEFVVGIIAWIAEKVSGGLVKPFVGLFEPVMGSWAWAGALGTVVLLLGGFYLFGSEGIRTAVAVAFWFAVLVAFLVGFGWLIGLVPAVFWTTAGAVAAWVFLVLVVLLALVTVGALVIDQLLSSKHAGSGRIGVVMGAIAIGSTLAMLMLVGNLHDVYDLYPQAIENWARAMVLSNDPKFDASMTLVVISLCAAGVLSNLFRMRPEPDLFEFRRSLVYTIMGMVTAGAIAALGKATSD